MYVDLIAFIWSLDKILLVFSAALAAGIVIYSTIENELADRRSFFRERAADVLRLLSSLDRQELLKSCSAVIEDTNPEEFIVITRLKGEIIPDQLAHDFQSCLASSDKIAYLEKQSVSSGNKWIRIQALMGIGAAGSARALEILTRAASNRDKDIAYYALLGLAQLKTREACRALIGFIPGRKFSGQKMAALLGGFPVEAREEILNAARSPDSSVRFWALRVLASFGDKRGLEEAIRLSSDPSPEVRSASCAYLSRGSGQEVIGALTARLSDSSWFVRLQAVRALHSMLQVNALGFIAARLGDENWFVREEVKKILFDYPKESMGYIKEALETNKISQKDWLDVLMKVWDKAE